MKQAEYKGKNVEFFIIQKDSKGNDQKIPQRGRIKTINKTGTGFVIQGTSVKGIYNRNRSDIVIHGLEPFALGVQITGNLQIAGAAV